MQVNEREMYHFHNNKVHNDIWVANNEITVDDNFESSYLNILKYFNIAVKTTSNRDESFDIIIDNYLSQEQSKETLINMLKEASHMIYGMKIFMRELALEEIRKQNYPNLPSRKHSIWLCDENGLDFWEDQISHSGQIPTDLYKVSVTGNLFKSSDEFLPNNYTNFETKLTEAENYWRGENIQEEHKVEYLFQGKLKILEKVKK